MDNVEQFQTVVAVLKPHEDTIDSLRPEYIKLIGCELELFCAWIAADDEMFAGQKIFTPTIKSSELIQHWIPECDLELVRIV